MTLEEAIQHTVSVVIDKSKCLKCRKEHLRLVSWLLRLQKQQLMNEETTVSR